MQVVNDKRTLVLAVLLSSLVIGLVTFFTVIPFSRTVAIIVFIVLQVLNFGLLIYKSRKWQGALVQTFLSFFIAAFIVLIFSFILVRCVLEI